MNAILVPTDFSKNADKALKYAIRLTQLMKCRLILVHGFQMTAYTLDPAKSEEQREEIIKKESEKCLKELQKQVVAAYHSLDIQKIPSTTKLLVEFTPFIVEKIIEEARKYSIKLIVMGTHGASGLKKLFFGSTTSIMISKSEIPVLAIPENYRYREIEKMAYASDFENMGVELEQVIPFAKGVGAHIDVVHLDYGLDSSGAQEKLATVIIKKHAYKKISLITQKAVLDYPLLKQLREYLDRGKPQWLIMFTRERGFWNKILLGSRTEDMANSLQVPLLSFKKGN